MIAAICDDIQKDREAAGRMLAGQMEERKEPLKIDYFEDGEDLIERYESGKGKYDLIILDIHMKHMNGMDTAFEVRRYDKKAAIIFLTVSPEFAVESYAVRACYYLLKPLCKEKFDDAINKLMEERRPRTKESLLIVSGSSGRRIAYQDIIYIESRRMNLRVVCDGGVEHTVRKKLSDVQKELTGPEFLRCNQSFIVNMDYITEADVNFTMKNGDKIPIKVRERKQIRDRYFAYMEEKKPRDF